MTHHNDRYGEGEDTVSTPYMMRIEAEFQKQGVRGITLLFASGDSGVASDDGDCPNGRFTGQWSVAPSLLPPPHPLHLFVNSRGSLMGILQLSQCRRDRAPPHQCSLSLSLSLSRARARSLSHTLSQSTFILFMLMCATLTSPIITFLQASRQPVGYRRWRH